VKKIHQLFIFSATLNNDEKNEYSFLVTYALYNNYEQNFKHETCFKTPKILCLIYEISAVMNDDIISPRQISKTR